MNESENSFDLSELIELRKTIHANPELAHEEKNTAERLTRFIKKFNPDKIIERIAGNGVAFIYEGNKNGPVILLRAELDALPITEECEFDYKSVNNGVSHKCGHDGHMTILAGLARKLNENKINKGKVVLLFQPAEEIGEGAEKIINDKKFTEIKPDYAFALHNLPGFKKHEIIIRNNTFAAASVGMKVELKGKTSHAAHPENGISPSDAVADIIKKFNSVINAIKNENFDFGLVTIIHVSIGEKAFGTSPGYAEVYATLRANSDADLEVIKSKCVEIVELIAKEEKLKSEISWTEAFPATVNDPEAVDFIISAANQLKLNIKNIDSPFRWTEDFGHFTKTYTGALFGLGAGKQTPQLHNPDYDFPDELILTGINIFHTIIQNILAEE
ncbi:MAG: amidohydrolase [Ignavibacteriae bacterium]|nr:amidohydrolase [Ignavibacteriota bacterium]NOG97942.1 amidohydrolase [Ignavibacteriota bacterium]